CLAPGGGRGAAAPQRISFRGHRAASQAVLRRPSAGHALERALRPGAAGGGAPAARRGPGSNPREPDQGRRASGYQPEHAAQENPRFGHRNLPRRGLACGFPATAGKVLRGVSAVSVTSADGTGQFLRRRVAWARRIGLERKLAITLLVAAIASGLTTYGVLT